MSYHWPGNIRELQNTIERAVIISRQPTIGDTDIILPERSFDPSENFNFNGSLKQVASRAVKIIEKKKISDVLKGVDFNRSRAAEQLEISYKTLLDKIKEYEISPED